MAQLILVAMLAGSSLAQMSTVPAYITSSKYSYPSLTSASLQSLLARQLYASVASPRRSVSLPSSSTSRYGAPAASNPSIVAIPLYVRNQAAAQKNAALYDILSSEKKASASNKYVTHLSKKAYGEPQAYRSETVVRYEKPTYTYAKYDQPKAAPSSYEPVRSYELKNSEPGYGDASSVSLLSSGYGQQQGSISIAYPPASYKQSTSRPQLKAVEYDDSQKSALSDFAAALENFDLKSITNQDIYDLPAINPPLTRLTSSKKQAEQRPAEDSYAASSPYSKSASYESPKQTYTSASYEDSRPSYAAQPSSPSYSSQETYSSYASPTSSSDGYRAADSYRPQAPEPTRAAAYSERPASEAYRASGSDSYATQASYVPAPSNYDTAAFTSAQEVYPSRSVASVGYGSSGGDYYAPAASSVRPNPDDPNCPYKDQAASAEYVSEPSSYSGKLSAAPSVKEESASGQGYESDELDPSKLDLKIVHLPVSVLKRLVGNGELALPSFNKKK